MKNQQANEAKPRRYDEAFKSMSDKHSIKDMCEALCVSHSGCYRWKNAGQSLRSQHTNRLIEKEYAKSRQT